MINLKLSESRYKLYYIIRWRYKVALQTVVQNNITL